MWLTLRWNTLSFLGIPFPIPPPKICSSLCQLSNPLFLQPAQSTHQYFPICKWTVSLIPSVTHCIGVVFWHVSAWCTEVILWSLAMTHKLWVNRVLSGPALATRLLVFQFHPWAVSLFTSCRVTPSLTGSNSDLFSFSANFINSGVGYDKSKMRRWATPAMQSVNAL